MKKIKLRRGSKRPHLSYVLTREQYKLFIPGSSSETIYFKDPHEVPKNIRDSWFLGKGTLAIARTGMTALQTRAEVFPTKNAQLYNNLKYYAKHKAFYEFKKTYRKWKKFNAQRYTEEEILNAYNVFVDKYAQCKL